MVEKSLGTFSNPLSYVAGAVCPVFVSVNISFSYISCVLVISLIMKVKFEISLLIRVQNPESGNPDFSGLNPDLDGKNRVLIWVRKKENDVRVRNREG